MTWYEKASKGYRARWEEPGRKTAAAGPVKPTREEARQWAVEHGHDREDIASLVDLINRWCSVKLAEKRIMPTYVAEVQRDLVKLAERRKWVAVGDVTMAAIDRWQMEAKGVGTSRHLAMLLSVLRWGRKRYGLQVDERAADHATPSPSRKVMASVLLTDEQVANIVEKAQGISFGAGALIHYLSTYGARPVTACTRLIGDVDFVEGTILVDGKRSGQWRHALLPETLAHFAACTMCRPPSDPLFLDPRTGKGWPLNWQHAAAVLCAWYTRVLGKPFGGERLKGIYDLKRYAITSMLKRGIDAPTVAKFTGHLTLAQVLLYARGNETTTRAALDRLCVPSTQNTQKNAGG